MALKRRLVDEHRADRQQIGRLNFADFQALVKAIAPKTKPKKSLEEEMSPFALAIVCSEQFGDVASGNACAAAAKVAPRRAPRDASFAASWNNVSAHATTHASTYRRGHIACARVACRITTSCEPPAP